MNYVLALLLIVGFTGFITHQRAYRALYRKLSTRQIMNSDYKPDWTSIAGAGACMGYITKLKREVGIDQLTAEEQALLRRVTVSYMIGVPAIFVFTCLVFWILYS